MPSEMFPPGVRAKAVGMSISTNWLTNFIVGPHYSTHATVYHIRPLLILLCLLRHPAGLGILLRAGDKGVRIEAMNKLLGEETKVRLIWPELRKFVPGLE
jgi:hypothetical protein